MGRRKHLAMGIEEFFALALLVYGTPSMTARTYLSRRFPMKGGYSFWCSETEDGQRWVALVSSAGEAKARAPLLYKWYLRWHSYPEDRRKAFAIKLQEGLPKSGKRAMYGQAD